MRFFNRLCCIAALCLTAFFLCELYLAAEGRTAGAKQTVFSYFSPEERRFRNYVGWANRCEYLYNSDEDPSVVIRILPDGMRECRPDRDKRTELNAAFIGCSCTFGEGVRAEDTEVWRLNERYPDVTFDNWGVCGWGPVQMYARLEQLLGGEKKYDLVVYNMIDDHKFRTYVPRALGSLKGNDAYVCSPYGNYDAFGRYRLYYAPDLRWPGEDGLLTVSFLKRVCYARRTELFQKRYDRDVCRGRDLENAYDCFFEIVERMRRLCGEHGVDFLVCDIQPRGFNDGVVRDARFKSECINVDHPRSREAALHVKGEMHNHPNGAVHAYWADRFSEWFDKRYEGYLDKRKH